MRREPDHDAARARARLDRHPPSPVNPIERSCTPRTAAEIQNRLNEISFNSPLTKELRMMALLQQVTDPGSGEGAMWARMRVHRIASDFMAELSLSSRRQAPWWLSSPSSCSGRSSGRSSDAARARFRATPRRFGPGLAIASR